MMLRIKNVCKNQSFLFKNINLAVILENNDGFKKINSLFLKTEKSSVNSLQSFLNVS